jgi:hypothetical protein
MGARCNDALAEARRLAREHGFVIAPVVQYRNPASIADKQPYIAYVLYRHRVRLGRRTSASALLSLIRSHLANADQPPAVR